MISKNQIKYVRSLEHKKFRDRYGVFVAEGPKLINDLKGSFELTDLFEGEDAIKLSFQDNPQGLLAVFKQREESDDCFHMAKSQLCLALDDVQNPGNMGTIIRLADWFGIEHIFCSRGSADIYNPKVVQATMGGLSRVHVHYCDLAEMVGNVSGDVPVYGTFLNGTNIYQTELSSTGLIVMGNEGHGISKDIEAVVTRRLLIPNYPTGRPTGESLNVAIATAIVCSEFRRRL